MPRYIDADELYEIVTKKYSDITAGCYPFNIVAHDMAMLVKNSTTADVVPRAEVEKWFRECEELQVRMIELEKEVAREIFEEIEAVLAVHTLSGKSKDYADGAFDTVEWVDAKLAELKKKYTEGVKSN